MYPIPTNNDREWNEVEGEVSSGGHSSKVHSDYVLEEIPEPPDFWTLQDFEDLLPIGSD